MTAQILCEPLKPIVENTMPIVNRELLQLSLPLRQLDTRVSVSLKSATVGILLRLSLPLRQLDGDCAVCIIRVLLYKFNECK
jgi:hypothetical protein